MPSDELARAGVAVVNREFARHYFGGDDPVGRRLFFSERTVKNIIHDVTSRLDLRNRTHAVAYAIRQGLI